MLKTWLSEKRIEETLTNLIKHGFDAVKVSDKSMACQEVLQRITPTQRVGVGGSVTLREIGLIARLKEQGNVLYDHWSSKLTMEESLSLRKAQQSCDVFITGANAITRKGEIVNVDGFGNRIAAMTFGPEHVMIVAGWNKIVQDIPEAIARVRTIAAPMNAKRFGLNPPCVELARCVDCDSPDRICRGTLILDRRPFATKMAVVIVQEELGY